MGYTSYMAQPMRKPRPQQGPESPSRKPTDEKSNIVELRVAANDNESEKRVAVIGEQNLYKPRTDKKMYQAFVRELKLQDKIERWKIYVPHAEENVAVTRAFPENEIVILEETEGEARMLRNRGYGGERGHAETHRGEDADLVIVLDESVPARWQLLHNVTPGGYLICHGKMAAAVRRLGKYEFKGVFDRERNAQVMENCVEKSEITEEKEFENATDKESGAVTYAEAREAVEKAFGTTKNVLERYKELVAEVKAKFGTRVSGHLPVLEYEYKKKDGTTVKLRINTILPLKDESENKVFVFKKWNL